MTTCSPPSAILAGEVGNGCGENAYKCYQCKKCSTGCPVAPYAAMHPAMIMRAVQLGQLDMIFDDKFIWLCTGCETCTTRCPQGIDIAAIMDELKIMARRDGRIAANSPFANVLRLNYESIKRWGRLYEFELIARDLLKRPKGALDYVTLAPKMMLKGKINFLPERGDTVAMKRMVETSESITRAKLLKASEAEGGES
jgi:heterodisulfide reductase subunit C2